MSGPGLDLTLRRRPTARALRRAAAWVRYLEGVSADAQHELEQARRVNAYLCERAAEAGWSPERIARTQRARPPRRWWRRAHAARAAAGSPDNPV